MGIDGIGSKGPVVPPAPSGVLGGAEKSGGPSADFSVGKAAPTAPAAAPTPLDRLRSGEIDATGYVDAKVDEATSHLAALPPAHLEAVRAALRERIASDPTLVELVRTATGKVPSVPEDGAG